MAIWASTTGAVWAAVYTSGLAGWSNSALRRAAVLQEMFDTRLLGLPWNAILAGQPVPAHDVNLLAKQFRGRESLVRDYYEIKDGLPAPFDVIACLQQNLGWGSRIHLRWAAICMGAVIVVASAGPMLAIVNELTVLQTISLWYVPALGFLLLGIDNWRAHRTVAKDREQALLIVEQQVDRALLDPAKVSDLPLVARDGQDLLLLTRLRTPRVPHLLFRRYHGTDREDFQATMEALHSRVVNRVQASP